MEYLALSFFENIYVWSHVSQTTRLLLLELANDVQYPILKSYMASNLSISQSPGMPTGNSPFAVSPTISKKFQLKYLAHDSVLWESAELCFRRTSWCPQHSEKWKKQPKKPKMSSYSAVKSELCSKFKNGCHFETCSATHLSLLVAGQQWHVAKEAKAKEGGGISRVCARKTEKSENNWNDKGLSEKIRSRD